MVGAADLRDGVGMATSNQYNESIAASTFELLRAAGDFEEQASGPGAVDALPLALADVERTLARLATGVVKVAEAVEERSLGSGSDVLSPEARALRWHLFHLAARLRGAQDASPEVRKWARLLLAQQDGAEDEEDATSEPPGPGRRFVAHGEPVAR
jgi:hypothetical protein